MNYGEPGKRVVVGEFGETPLGAVEEHLRIDKQEPPDPASLSAGDVVVAIRSAAVGANTWNETRSLCASGTETRRVVRVRPDCNSSCRPSVTSMSSVPKSESTTTVPLPRIRERPSCAINRRRSRCDQF